MRLKILAMICLVLSIQSCALIGSVFSVGGASFVPDMTSVLALPFRFAKQMEKIIALSSDEGFKQEYYNVMVLGFDPDRRDENGRTLLMEAVRAGKVREAQFLLLKGASVDARDTSGWTALMHCTQNSNIQAMELLLDYKADVNLKDGFGNTALIYCAQNGNSEMLTRLIRCDAEVGVSSRLGWTALMSAAQMGHLKAMEILLNAFSKNIDASDDSGWTALMYAVSTGSMEAVKLLLNHGANPKLKANRGTYVGSGAIDLATFSGFADIADLLYQLGARRNSERKITIYSDKSQD